MSKPYLSVIIPAYNEAKRLPLTLIDVDKHLHRKEYNYEVIVVNDGSTDNTGEILSRFQPLIKNFQVIDNKDNQGKGAAVRLGMLAAKGNYRLFMDADNNVPVSEFDKLAPHLKEGYDVVIGSQYASGAKALVRPPFFRWLTDRKMNFFMQWFIVKGIRDSFCGFKAFSESAAMDIFSALKTNRWAFDAEALLLARRMDYKIKEVPVTWASQGGSHLSLWRYWQIIGSAIKIAWKNKKS